MQYNRIGVPILRVAVINGGMIFPVLIIDQVVLQVVFFMIIN